MDTIQPPILEPAQDSPDHEKPLPQTVANQGKHSDTRVALAVKEKRGNRSVTPKGWRHKGPAKWAAAMKLFVSGELGTWQAVAEHMGVDYRTVARKAATEDWIGLRKAQVARLVDMARTGDGLAVVPSKASLASIAQAQAEIAASLMDHVKTMQIQANAVATSVLAVSDRLALARDTDTDPINRRLLALAQVHAGLVDTIRVLAGLPHPDRQPRQAIAKPKPTKAIVEPRTRAMTAPLGVDPEAKQSIVGEGEEEGDGGGGQGVPAPLGGGDDSEAGGSL